MFYNSIIEEIVEEMKSIKEELSFLEELLFKIYFDIVIEKIK